MTVAGLPVAPMLASVGEVLPAGRAWTFEPKYDGVRVIVDAGRGVRLWTRNGNDKAAQFPEVVSALAELRRRAGRSFVADGELVALVHGKPGRFQALQQRVGLKGASDVAAQAERAPAAIVLFDLLRDGRDQLLNLPWRDRRARLAALLGAPTGAPAPARDAVPRHVRLAPSQSGGAAMLARARREGWEGVIAKRVDAPYQAGARSDSWQKLKLEHRAEFVVGGFTAPRNSRQHLGALLLGYYDDAGRLVYVGHTGGGFTRDSLAAMHRRLRPLVRLTPPFAVAPRTNEPATWVRPAVVVEVRFNEWTNDGRLRQPIYLGTRDDKAARDVTREAASMQRAPRTGART